MSGCVDREGEVLSSVGGDGGARADAPLGDAGIATDGDVAPCEEEVACAAEPLPGAVTVCGRLLDVETSAYVGDPAVEIRFINPIASDLTVLATTHPDACGRFVVDNVLGLLPGYVIVTTDDDNLLGGDYVRVASMIPVALGNSVRTNVFAMRADTDVAWSAAAGLGDRTFSERGAVVAIFLDARKAPVSPFQGAPIEGVAITEDGAVDAARDHYFADTQPSSRATLAPARALTGANGSAIMTGPLPTHEYSGTHAACVFGEVRGAIPGLVQVQEMFGTCH